MSIYSGFPAILEDTSLNWEAGFSIDIDLSKMSTAPALSFVLPLTQTGVNDFAWRTSDGQEGNHAGEDDLELFFPHVGTFSLQITGVFWGCRFFYKTFDYNLGVTNLRSWGNRPIATCYGMFSGCSNLEISATDKPDISQSDNLISMFEGCSLVNPDVSGWDTAHIKNMNNTFNKCYSAELDVSGWDTGSCTSFSRTFSGCRSSILDVSGWSTSLATSMENMFEHTVADLDVSNFETANVTSFSSMFASAETSTLELGGFDMSSAIMTVGMLGGLKSPSLTYLDISEWDMSNVTNMSFMFRKSFYVSFDVSSWDVSKVTNFSYIFDMINPPDKIQSAINPDVSGWDTSSVTLMSSMFSGLKVANPDVSNFDMSKVTMASSMFNGCLLADPQVHDWDMSSCIKITNIFMGSNATTSDVSGWDTSKVTHMDFAFHGSKLNFDLSGWDVTSLVDATNMLNGATYFSTANYDALLLSWSQQAVQPDVPFGCSSEYTISGEAGRSALINNPHNWTISDLGADPVSYVTIGGNNITIEGEYVTVA